MVNILISTYNGKKYIEEQLDSIRGQSYQDFEVYIRDDGSSDGTEDVVKAYVEKYALGSRVHLMEADNVGFCKSFFELLRWSESGDYWAFCDQDDYWYPDKLLHAVEWFSQNEGNGMPLLYHSGFEVGNADLSERRAYPVSEFPYQFYNSITSNIFFGFSIVINRNLRERLLLANPNVIKYHDWFGAMITAAFGKYHMSDRIDAIHRQHEKNSSPLYFLKKIPHGIKLLRGDDFYDRQAREFLRLFGGELEEGDREILGWFAGEGYSFRLACKKTFYKRRWNPQLKVEVVQRLLMLFGKI